VASNARRILVVDDNRDSATSLALVLRMSGHTVEVAADGPGALQAVASFQPDLILLDIGLPGMNGYDTCRAIRAQPGAESVVIAAVTGWGQQEDHRKSREAGFDAHLVKPVEQEALLALIAASRR
jgi:CheY-like chemotaxis protein